MKRQVLIGTHNKHKAVEISAILADLGVEIKTLNDFPDVAVVDEDGMTLEENAAKKAREYGQKTGLLTLADDTGLEVDALDGAPGVYSARYAGENCTYQMNNSKLLRELKDVKGGERSARFRCVIACFDPQKKKLKITEGRIDGTIVESIRGDKGFGYDPVFFVPQLSKTLAELTLEQKNKISHRAQAVESAKEILKGML